MFDFMRGLHTYHKTFIGSPVEKVFKQLTTGEGWDAWFTQGTVVNISEEPYYIKFVWKDFGLDKVTLEDGGPVLEVIPNRKFVFNWYPVDKETPITVTFKLSPVGSGTILEVSDSGYSNIEEHLVQLIDCAQGWAEAITLLKFYLEHHITYGKIP